MMSFLLSRFIIDHRSCFKKDFRILSIFSYKEIWLIPHSNNIDKFFKKLVFYRNQNQNKIIYIFVFNYYLIINISI
jgi:hypothetical protein